METNIYIVQDRSGRWSPPISEHELLAHAETGSITDTTMIGRLQEARDVEVLSSVFNQIRRTSNEIVDTYAERLIAFSRVNAVGSFQSIAKASPQLNGIASNEFLEVWDATMFLASLGTALIQVRQQASVSDAKHLGYALRERLVNVDVEVYGTFVDFLDSVRTDCERGIEVSVAIGSWITRGLQQTLSGFEKDDVLLTNTKFHQLLGNFLIGMMTNWHVKMDDILEMPQPTP